MTDELVERIYEAAFVPEAWPLLLQSLADRVEATGAGLILDRGARSPLTASTAALEEALADYCDSGAWQSSELTAYARHAPPATFLLDEDFFPRDVMRREANSAMIPLGVGALLGTVFPMPSGETAVIVLQRDRDASLPHQAALGVLNGMRPHLGRAALIAGRLHLERATSTVRTLSQLGLPAAVITAGAVVLAANDRFQALRAPFRIGAFDRLSLAVPAAQALFAAAIEENDAGASAVKSIPVPARADDAAMIVHVAPVERGAHDVFDRAASVVIVTPLDAAGVPDGAMLNGLFDLTPAEARLVQKLAQGLTINEIAADLALSVPTLRTQLRAVFAKTGTTRQAELGRLVGAMVRAPTRS
ncbi:MAG: helix-turn-helix transcriptional regulator [Pseudomonadota bacterium]